MTDSRIVHAPLDWVSVNSVLALTGVRSVDLCALLEKGEIIGGRLASGSLLIDRSSVNAAVKILDIHAAVALARSASPVGEVKEDELTLEQAATLAGVSPRTVRSAIRRGELDAGRRGSGSRSPYRLCHLAVMAWRAKTSPSSAATFEALTKRFLKKNASALDQGKTKKGSRGRRFWG